MPKSSAFTQIKEKVLEITLKIPEGRVSTYGAIAEHLNVMARHVAYILATLTFAEQENIPWYRVVADQGAITASKKFNSRHLNQIEYLKTEGVEFTTKNMVQNFDELFCHPQDLVTWDNSKKRYLID